VLTDRELEAQPAPVDRNSPPSICGNPEQDRLQSVERASLLLGEEAARRRIDPGPSARPGRTLETHGRAGEERTNCITAPAVSRLTQNNVESLVNQDAGNSGSRFPTTRRRPQATSPVTSIMGGAGTMASA